MMIQRRPHSAEFKAKVALEAIRCPPGGKACVSGGCNGLIQPVCAVLGRVDHRDPLLFYAQGYGLHTLASSRSY